jgi:hypothetical protein
VHGKLHLLGTCYIAENLRPVASLIWAAQKELLVKAPQNLLALWVQKVNDRTGFRLWVEVKAEFVDCSIKTGLAQQLRRPLSARGVP